VPRSSSESLTILGTAMSYDLLSRWCTLDTGGVSMDHRPWDMFRVYQGTATNTLVYFSGSSMHFQTTPSLTDFRSWETQAQPFISPFSLRVPTTNFSGKARRGFIYPG
jgi:hypothetical protein